MTSDGKVRNRRPKRPKSDMTTALDATARGFADRLAAAEAAPDAKWEEIEALRQALAAAGYRKVKRWQAWFPLSADASRAALTKLKKTPGLLTAHEVMSLERSVGLREEALAATAGAPATLTAVFNDTPRGLEERDLFLKDLPKGARKQEDGALLVRTADGFVRIVVSVEADPNPQHLAHTSFQGEAAAQLYYRLGRKRTAPLRRSRRRR